MQTYAFEYRKWTKKHEFVIEQCYFLHISQILGWLKTLDEQNLSNNLFLNFPWLKIVPTRGGFCTKWWFACPICGRRCENLYREPDSELEDWGCRKCKNLIYASQRYGHRNPLRKRLTPRKQTTLKKRKFRERQKLNRLQKKQNHVVPSKPCKLEKTNLEVTSEMTKSIFSWKPVTLVLGRPMTREKPLNQSPEKIQSEIGLEQSSINLLKDIAKNDPSTKVRKKMTIILRSKGIDLE